MERKFGARWKGLTLPKGNFVLPDRPLFKHYWLNKNVTNSVKKAT